MSRPGDLTINARSFLRDLLLYFSESLFKSRIESVKKPEDLLLWQVHAPRLHGIWIAVCNRDDKSKGKYYKSMDSLIADKVTYVPVDRKQHKPYYNKSSSFTFMAWDSTNSMDWEGMIRYFGPDKEDDSRFRDRPVNPEAYEAMKEDVRHLVRWAFGGFTLSKEEFWTCYKLSVLIRKNDQDDFDLKDFINMDNQYLVATRLLRFESHEYPPRMLTSATFDDYDLVVEGKKTQRYWNGEDDVSDFSPDPHVIVEAKFYGTGEQFVESIRAGEHKYRPLRGGNATGEQYLFLLNDESHWNDVIEFMGRENEGWVRARLQELRTNKPKNQDPPLPPIQEVVAHVKQNFDRMMTTDMDVDLREDLCPDDM